MIRVDARVDDRHDDTRPVGIPEDLVPRQPAEGRRPREPVTSLRRRTRRSRPGWESSPRRSGSRLRPTATEQGLEPICRKVDGIGIDLAQAGDLLGDAPGGIVRDRWSRAAVAVADQRLDGRIVQHGRTGCRGVVAPRVTPTRRGGARPRRWPAAGCAPRWSAARAMAPATSRSRNVKVPPRRSRTSSTPIVPSASVSGVARIDPGT